MKAGPIFAILSILAPFLGAGTYAIIASHITITDTTSMGFGSFLVVEIMFLAFMLGLASALVSLQSKGPFRILALLGLLLNGLPPLYFFLREGCI